jgi:hypothetical protein
VVVLVNGIILIVQTSTMTAFNKDTAGTIYLPWVSNCFVVCK